MMMLFECCGEARRKAMNGLMTQTMVAIEIDGIRQPALDRRCVVEACAYCGYVFKGINVTHAFVDACAPRCRR